MHATQRVAIALVVFLLLAAAGTAVHVVGQQSGCPSWMSAIADPNVTCRPMTDDEKDAMDEGARGQFDDSDEHCGAILNHSSDWLYNDTVWVVSGGNLRTESGTSSPYLYAGTGSNGERVIRSDKVSIMWGILPFHEGPHLHWYQSGTSSESHTWWDVGGGSPDWRDYCRDPDDFASPPSMPYSFIED